ncbi:MAG TPA: folylpolyglutamate synthase/dihydrofolate synthase family protein [Gemmataceae bacterium]
MTYDEALAFWYGRVNYERKAPQPGDLKLDRMRALLHRLGDPHDRLRTVHVAGSKGKGSTCAMLASVLRHAGYRTGLFTSPHLTDVRERIQIDGELIGRDELAALMAEIRPAVEELEAADEPPTFFEVGTALGFLHFLRHGCDIAVIEVGLGGRFDSTNVLTPLVSVITSISLDHTQMLGDRVEQIAFEKAGIIKPGVPVVSGVTEPGPRAVIERVAAERGAALAQLESDFRYVPVLPGKRLERSGKRLMSAVVRTPACEWTILVGLPGSHQLRNASLVVATVERLDRAGFRISDADVREGIRSVKWPARFEFISTKPPSILDCAHNVASAQALVETLHYFFLPRRRVLIFAISSDKDVPGMFRVLAPHFRRFYLTRYQQSTRAVPPDELAAMLPPDVERVICPTPADAWHAAVADATPETLVVVAGSVFLAGELRPLLVQASGVA